MESQRAQAAVGSDGSGMGSGACTPEIEPPRSRVAGSKVAPQAAHT